MEARESTDHGGVASDLKPEESAARECLRACADGRHEGLRAIYQNEGGRMLAFARRMLGGDDQAAQDVLQDCLVMVWKQAHRYDPERGKARAWLYAILRFRVIDQLRRRVRDPDTASDTMDDWADVFSDPADSILNSDSRRELKRCIELLDADRRRPIMLAFFHGMTHREIAETLTLPLGTIKGRIRAALKKLGECLQ